MKAIALLFAALAIAVGLWAYHFTEDEPQGPVPYAFWKASAMEAAPKATEDRDAQMRRIITEKINEIMRRTEARNRMAVDSAEADVSSAVDKSARRARENIPLVLSVLTNFKGCAKLCWLMGKDKVNGTAETERHIGATLDQHILVHALQGAKDVEGALARLSDELARNRTDMAVEMATATQGVIASAEPDLRAKYEDFARALGQSREQVTAISADTMKFTLGMTIEAVFLKVTIGQVQRVLGAIAARMGTAVSASLFSAAADGPLPIGDIIGLVIAAGGVAWSAYDLHKAQGVLKTELEASLNSAVHDYQHQTVAEGAAAIRKLSGGYAETNRRTVESVLTKLTQGGNA